MTCDGLVLIDLQNGMFDGTNLPPVWRAEALLRTLRSLVAAAREVGVPVCFVRHAGGPGHPLEEGTPSWDFHPEFTPGPDELSVVKRTPDSFHGTHLDQLLRAAHVTAPAIAGIQSEFCVDTTCRRAFSLGYEATLAEDGHSTWDAAHMRADEIIRHHNTVLEDWFVRTRPAAAIKFGP